MGYYDQFKDEEFWKLFEPQEQNSGDEEERYNQEEAENRDDDFSVYETPDDDENGSPVREE